MQRFEAQHRFIPPICPNANADVESVHATIEAELFDADPFNNREEVFSKIAYLSTLLPSSAQESFSIRA